MTTPAYDERERIKKIIEGHRVNCASLTEHQRGNNFAIVDILKAIDDQSPETPKTIYDRGYSDGCEAGRLSVGSTVEKHADHDERGNRVLCDSILDEIANP